jgi:hypothetical protein
VVGCEREKIRGDVEEEGLRRKIRTMKNKVNQPSVQLMTR